MDLKKTDLGGKNQQWEPWLSTVPDAPYVPGKRQRFASTPLADWILHETTGVNAMNYEDYITVYWITFCAK